MTVMITTETGREVEAFSSEKKIETLDFGRPFPAFTVRRYARLAAQMAMVEQTEEGTYFADVEGFPGVWAEADTEDEAREELESVIYGWALLKIEEQDKDLPIIGDINLNVI